MPNTGGEGFILDNGTIWMGTTIIEGRRIVLEAILDYEACFLANPRPQGRA